MSLDSTKLLIKIGGTTDIKAIRPIKYRILKVFIFNKRMAFLMLKLSVEEWHEK